MSETLNIIETKVRAAIVNADELDHANLRDVLASIAAARLGCPISAVHVEFYVFTSQLA